MPVIDHEVHPSTRIGADHRYGCWSRDQFADGYYAPNGYAEIMDDRDTGLDARIGLKFIPHRMSTECRFDMSLSDPNCSGCKHRGSGENYDAMVRGRGA